MGNGTRVTKQEFLDRLSPSELVALLTAARQSVEVEAWLFKFNSVTPDADGTSIDLRDARTISGVNALAAAGLLAPHRPTEILSLPASEWPAVGGYAIGDYVRVLPPFDGAYPGVWVVEGFGPEAVVLEGGASFSPTYLERV